VGLYTTLEQLIGAILYARNLAERSFSTGDFCFRLELYPSTARLMYEPPSLGLAKPQPGAEAEVVEFWPLQTAQVSSPIRIAGTFRADADDVQLAALLNEVAHGIAVFFGLEKLVAALQPGAHTASLFDELI
jgi:hypothetical protein